MIRAYPVDTRWYNLYDWMMSESVTPRMDDLFDEAVSKYGVTCLWNCKRENTSEGLALIASRLRAHGDMNAWRLAAKIDDGLRHGP